VPEDSIHAEDHSDSIDLRRSEKLPQTTLEDLVGCTDYKGLARSLEEMEDAIAKGAGDGGRS
jgi:hypothetical protein